jgi:DNA-binding MarR family transcriptional regulator
MPEPLESSARRRADPADPSFELRYSPFVWLSRVSGRYLLDMGQALRRVRMDVPRWRVLMILHENDPASVSTIAELAVIKLSTMTRIVQRMQVDGLVTCAPRATDARVTEVRLTPAGIEAMEQARAPTSRIFRHAFHDVSDADMAAFTRVLQKLFDNLESPPD